MSVANIIRLCLHLAIVAASPIDDLAFAYPLSADTYPKARCLDGTQGMYYMRKGHGDGLTKFYLHQQGGGFCESLEDCRFRSWENLGSTSPRYGDGWGPTLNLSTEQMYFSQDPDTNPLMHNWNHVFMVYCDGGYFAGDNTSEIIVHGDRLYFSGRHILDAILHDLALQNDMRHATDVILGGCSAGAIATFLHLDYVAKELKGVAPQARVVGFPDSGFYLDLPFLDAQKVFPYVYQNMSVTMSQACLHDNHNEPHKCLFAEVNAVYLQTPLFAWQSKFDGDQIWNSFETPCAKDPECAMQFANRMTSSMQRTLFRDGAPDHGAFLDGCWRHCQWANNGGNLSKIKIGSLTPLKALDLWHRKVPGQHLKAHLKALDPWFHVQQAPAFPCQDCCGPLTPDTTPEREPSTTTEPPDTPEPEPSTTTEPPDTPEPEPSATTEPPNDEPSTTDSADHAPLTPDPLDHANIMV